MIELQILNKVLQDGDTDFLTKNGIDESFFKHFRPEYDFIIGHYKKFGTVPDKQTIVANEDLQFEFFTVNESDDYLLYSINEEKVYNQCLDALKECSEIMESDSQRAVQLLRDKISSISRSTNVGGIDITKDTTRLQSIKDKQSGKSVTIKSGLKELDDILYGWLPGEELVTVVGRPGQGKSWLLIYFLVSAWQQGKRVGMYSGEMGADRVGYRIDTLINNFSNRSLVRGTIDEVDEYKNYLDGLSERKNPFFVVTKRELGGRATISKLRAFAESNKLDILGIDQYSLLRDERSNRNSSSREQLEHLSSDLFELSVDLGIPIIVLSQSNRNGAKEADNGTPDIEDIYGADAIAQNATKVITLRQTAAGLELAVKKNRDDPIGDPLLYFWDIDSGILKNIPTVKGKNPERAQTIRNRYNDERDVF